jgi:glycerol-3-phosphate acyltransferase PlsY
MATWLLVLCCYFLGSLSGSLLLGKWRGVDIRHLGSGNAGGTNAFRTQGVRFALGVVIIDIGKGLLAAFLAQRLFGFQHDAVFLAVFAAIVGHIWPVFHGFRGGKGAATLVGGLILAWPQALLVLLVVWVFCLMLSGYVGLSTVIAAVSLLVSAYLFHADWAHWEFAVACAVLITYSHRSNLQRVWQGDESRFEKARVLGRLIFPKRG